MDPSAVQEVKKPDQYLSASKTTPLLYEEKKLNATSVSALDMILESLWKIRFFFNAYWLDYVESAPPKEILRTFLLNNLSLTHSLESNDVLKLFLNILELLPRCYSHFEVDEVATTICIRCKMNMAYSRQRSYGIIVNADSLRVYNSVFVINAFETTLKIIRLNVKMLCDKEGCGKRNYVQRMINNLPTVFTIALQWENNETSIDIFRAATVLETEICISAIYRYKCDSLYTKYHLVSMVCSHGDQYNCIAYENNRWVRYFGSAIEVIGDWKSVVNSFLTHDIRPEILFFESVRKLLGQHTCLCFLPLLMCVFPVPPT
ncbi:PREDICTED: uncharacterized protein LOC104704603 [Camelina sativa]|uniref:Uncharacterized protein LOC104704603 n=1 Tax=Camelina sativa TaxID=90675 RepID=A0ABM1Q766_CAMSA|nr:PREDICTED: uncharacterized protein LOC104704603 [Camelina sativa]